MPLSFSVEMSAGKFNAGQILQSTELWDSFYYVTIICFRYQRFQQQNIHSDMHSEC